MIFLRSFYSFVSLAIWVCVWELIVLLVHDQSLFPHLFDIFINTSNLFLNSDFVTKHLFQSLYRLSLALLFAVPLAYFIALAAVKNKFFEKLITTFVSITFPLPKIALLPLFLLFFGIGDLTKVVLIAVSVFYLVFISTYDGVQRLTTSDLMDVVKIYKIKGWSYWYHFLVKGSLRFFLVGLKSGLGYGLTMVVVSEYSLSNGGLGYFIWSSWDQFRVLDMYSGILVIAILGFSLNKFCSLLITLHEKRFAVS